MKVLEDPLRHNRNEKSFSYAAEVEKLYNQMAMRYESDRNQAPPGWQRKRVGEKLMARLGTAQIAPHAVYGEILSITFLPPENAPGLPLPHKAVEVLLHALAASVGVWHRGF